MKISARTLCIGIFLFVFLTFGVAAFAADIDGTWTATVTTPMGDLHYTYDFKSDGKTLTGTAKTEMAETKISDGVINGKDVSFVEKLDFNGQEIVIKYKGTIDGDKINFDREVVGITNEKMVATRKKA